MSAGENPHGNLRSVELPESLISQVEELMKEKLEGRPVEVSLGLFIADLIQDSLERTEARSLYSPILEDYAVEKDRVFIKDNKKDVVVELSFKDGVDLYCNIDSAKNCVHIGYALSMPKVQKLIYDKQEK